MMRMCATIAFLLFRMKTVIDLRRLINDYKKDVSEHGSLLAPEIRNGLMLYINSNLKNAKPIGKAKIVAKLAPGQYVNINALCTSIKRVLQTINDMKKHLTRTWKDIVYYLNLKFELPLNESQTNTFKNPFSSVSALHTSQTDTSCSIPINLRSSSLLIGTHPYTYMYVCTCICKDAVSGIITNETTVRYIHKHFPESLSLAL